MLTKQQAAEIYQAAKVYSDKRNMAGAITVISELFEKYKVGFTVVDILILSRANDTASLKELLEGYAFWPS